MAKVFLPQEQYDQAISELRERYGYDQMSDTKKEIYDHAFNETIGVKGDPDDPDNTDPADSGDPGEGDEDVDASPDSTPSQDHGKGYGRDSGSSESDDRDYSDSNDQQEQDMSWYYSETGSQQESEPAEEVEYGRSR